jgi:predicted Zn-dependent peptidase
LSTQDVSRVPLCEGVNFTDIKTDKFKFCRVTVNFILPLRADTAAVNALLPSVLRRGCAQYPDMTSMNRRLKELYGASLDTSVSKTGGMQVLTLSCEVLGDSFALSRESLVRSASGLLKSVIFDPVLENGAFRAEDVAVERQNLADLIDSRLNDKRCYASQRMKELMCSGEPYGLCELGTREQALAVTPAELYRAWVNILTSSRAEVFFAGSSGADECRGLFASAFGAVIRRPCAALPAAELKTASGARSFTDRLSVAQAKLGLGFRSGTAHPSADVPAMQLACAVFGGTPRSLLFKNVRERLSLCYYCYSYYEPFAGLVFVESGVEEANAEKAKDEILRQLDDLRSGRISSDDLSEAVLLLTNIYRGLDDSLGGISGWYLGQSLLGRMKTPGEAAAKIAAVSIGEVASQAGRLSLDTVYLLAGDKSPGGGKELD